MKKRKLLKSLFIFLLATTISFISIACDNGSSENNPVDSTPKTGSGFPEFKPNGGFFKEKQTVSISAYDKDGNKAKSIYYTILKQAYDSNGNWNEQAWKEAVRDSYPTEESKKYQGEFEVSEQPVFSFPLSNYNPTTAFLAVSVCNYSQIFQLFGVCLHC